MMQQVRHIHRLPWTVGALALASAGSATAQEGPLRGIDHFISSVLADWRVPGAAVAVVKGDSLVLARGYGVRSLATGEHVDSATVFGIMSMTKAFTATAMGMLVDEGKVGWDDKVIEYLPHFQVYDEWVTREFTIRDLLSHRVGVERGDFLWFGTGYSRDEIVSHVRYLRPVVGFRTQYGYSNNMYITAGQLIAAVTGLSWDEVIRRRIFQPLGMRSSYTSVRDLAAVPNRAAAHEELHGRLQPIPYRSLDNEAPGGSINSNVLDMSRWARFHLSGGVIQGRRLIEAATLAETHSPQTIMPVNEGLRQTVPGVHFAFYGFGWRIFDYRARKVVQHSGGIDGQRSRIALLPEEELAVVVLTNRGRDNSIINVIQNWVFDAYLGAKATDWNARFLDQMRRDRSAAAAREQRVAASRVAGTQPSLPLNKYTGVYVDSAYGEGRIYLDNGQLVMEVGPEIRGVLAHWHYDTFRAVWDYAYLETQLVTFKIDPRGEVAGVTMAGWWPRFQRTGDIVRYVGGPR